jgi:histidinol-phosphate/aromatic aminotransferase/cobyric acid decarboxylase-like protein
MPPFIRRIETRSVASFLRPLIKRREEFAMTVIVSHDALNKLREQAHRRQQAALREAERQRQHAALRLVHEVTMRQIKLIVSNWHTD